jgi:NAD+ diphosphatase
MSDEFTRRLPLSRHATDRRAEWRTKAGLLDELMADARTRVIALHNGKALVRGDALRTFSIDELASHTEVSSAGLLFLGVSTAEAPGEPVGTPFLAVAIDDAVASKLGPSTEDWGDLRLSGTSLTDRDAGLFTQALALANWHRTHAHAPNNGKPTVPANGGWVRHPEDDSSAHLFPRTDSAVIVLVTDDQDRLLLGNNAMWESNRYSLLAGYVEPGESLESAVIREVFEESGLEVVNPTYLGSQPWPFPASLMMGFHARLASGVNPDAHAADGEEILHLRWFTRDELRANRGEIILPGPASIARAMVEQWLGERVE